MGRSPYVYDTRSTCNNGVPAATLSSVQTSAGAATARSFSSARTMLTPNSDSNRP